VPEESSPVKRKTKPKAIAVVAWCEVNGPYLSLDAKGNVKINNAYNK
jgi:hypothetical protein